MKLDFVNVKCAICGEESEQAVLLSNTVLGKPDLDMKPNGSMSSLGEGIQECPFCHYCNYNIGEFNQERFKTTLEPLAIWNSDEDIQDIIENEPEEDARKFRIMAEIYYGNLDYNMTYAMLVKAYWCSNIEKNKNQYREDALNIFRYTLLEDEIKRYIQLSDISRQKQDFKSAKNYLEIAKKLYDDLPIDASAESTKLFEDSFDFEDELISSKDTNRHSLDEY